MTLPQNRKENFNKALNILQELKDKVFISLTPPFDLKFEIDRNILNDILSKNKINMEDFRSQLYHISSLLLAILRKQEKSFVDFYLDKQELTNTKEEEEVILNEELTETKKRLYNSHLQRRYDLKKSSKAPSFVNIDWDIKVKTRDSKVNDELKLPYATCKILYQKIFEYSPYYVLGGSTIDTVQINFAKDDVDYLIRVLEKIKSHLNQIEEEIADEFNSKKNAQ